MPMATQRITNYHFGWEDEDGTPSHADSGKALRPALALLSAEAVGGTPESVVRAASYGLPLVVAVIGGSPDRFAPLVELYHRALDHYGHPTRPISMHSPGHVAGTDDEAREQMFPYQSDSFTRIGRERGWGPYTREQFDDGAAPTGSIFVGSPETVAQKIAKTAKSLGIAHHPTRNARIDFNFEF